MYELSLRELHAMFMLSQHARAFDDLLDLRTLATACKENPEAERALARISLKLNEYRKREFHEHGNELMAEVLKETNARLDEIEKEKAQRREAASKP